MSTCEGKVDDGGEGDGDEGDSVEKLVNGGAKEAGKEKRCDRGEKAEDADDDDGGGKVPPGVDTDENAKEALEGAILSGTIRATGEDDSIRLGKVPPGADADANAEALEGAILSGAIRATGEEASICLAVEGDDGGGVGKVGDGEDEGPAGRRVYIIAPGVSDDGGGDDVDASTPHRDRIPSGSATAPAPLAIADKGHSDAASAAAPTAPATSAAKDDAGAADSDNEVKAGCHFAQPTIARMESVDSAASRPGSDSIGSDRNPDHTLNRDELSRPGDGEEGVTLPGAWQITGPARRSGPSYAASAASRAATTVVPSQGVTVVVADADTAEARSETAVAALTSSSLPTPRPDDVVARPSSEVIDARIVDCRQQRSSVCTKNKCKRHLFFCSSSEDKEGVCCKHRVALSVLVGLVALLGVALGLGLGLSDRDSGGSSEGEAAVTPPTVHAPSNHSFNYLALRDVLYAREWKEDLRGLDNPSGPQHRALTWLADEDPAALAVGDDASVIDPMRARQRYALAALYYATNGTEWQRSCCFLSGAHECDWNENGMGVFCDVGGGSAASDRAVTVLELRANNLRGRLPMEFFWLSNMTKIALTSNQLLSPLSSSIGKLKKLTFLDLAINHISGSIPTQIGLLSELSLLWLGSNHFTGTVPDLRSWNLTHLRALDLSSNKLTGTIPESIGLYLSNLEHLSLHTNYLRGSIPSSLAGLTNLERLALSSNDFDRTPLPDLIYPGSFPSLRWLVCEHCNLSGTIPEAVETMTALEALHLDRNRLRGTLPERALGTLTHLVKLNLEKNELSGTVPGGWGGNSLPGLGGPSGSLRHLFLGGNRLEGTIPVDLFLRNPNLSVLSLQGNHISGAMPSTLGGMERMWLLDLGSNDLTDGIPEGLGNSSELRYLELSDNRLNGTVPGSLGRLKKLDWLSVARNDLTGEMSPLCDGESTDIATLLADCAEVHCPCCSACCCDDGARDGNDECGRVFPVLTLIRNLCFQMFQPKRSHWSEQYREIICTPDSYLEQLERNEEKENRSIGFGSRRMLRKY